ELQRHAMAKASSKSTKSKSEGGDAAGVAKSGDSEGKIFVGRSKKPEVLTLAFANRHGLVTGATGTGKTVTLQVLAEGFSNAGVSVFAADVKGDLSGVSEAGEAKEAFVARAKGLGFDYEPDQF